jgi:hypothetical protein
VEPAASTVSRRRTAGCAIGKTHEPAQLPAIRPGPRLASALRARADFLTKTSWGGTRCASPVNTPTAAGGSKLVALPDGGACDLLGMSG